MQELNWNDLRFVLAVARSESMASASRILGVNETTVARRTKHIENQLQARLFDRINSFLVPTKAGEIVIASAERVELETQNMENLVAGTDYRVAGTVRLTTVPFLLNHVLMPALSNLINNHPDLKFELVAEPRDLSLSKREADIALRLARPTKELGAITRRLGSLDYAVFAAKAQNTNSLPWITYENSMEDLPQAQWIAGQMKKDNSHKTVSANDAEAIFAGVKAGIGKSLLPVVIGDLEPNLMRLDNEIPVSREIWLLTHPELQKLPRIRATIEWLISCIDGIS